MRRGLQTEREEHEGSLLSFVRRFWHVVEPARPLVDGWVLSAIAQHLEAVTYGHIQKLLINVPPGSMKALDSDTPILTTWGWKRHGDLMPGDFVYGPDGRPRRVIACTQEVEEEAFEVEFDDATKIVAGAGHLWDVEREIYSGPRQRTSQIVETPNLRVSTRSSGGFGPDRIPTCAAILSPPRRLFVDPYLLGCWLGDGATDAGCIYAAEQDIHHFKSLGRIGSVTPIGGARKQAFYRIQVDRLQFSLRALGLLGHKHIPVEYLEASAEQRLNLLQGLMDTDGSCTTLGECSYTTVLPELADNVKELAQSLGMKAFVRSRFTKLNGKTYGPHFRISFTAPDDMRIFRLERKQARVKPSYSSRSRGRYVTAVTPVGLRKVKCIQVEGSRYLAGKELVPTHNSLLVSVFWPAWEYAIGLSHHRFLMFSYAAHLTARDNRRFLDVIESPLYQEMFGDRVHVVKRGEDLITTAEKGWKMASSIGGTSTGERADRVILDDPDPVKSQNSKEVHEKTNEWVGSAMMNRLNDMAKSAIVIIQQRVHENDVTGFILSKDLGFHHLMIQAEYDPSYHCSTAIGWTDPRTEYGEIFWPERFPPHVLVAERRIQGINYGGQYQQTPHNKGGGIFQRDYWQDWLEPVYPQFRFVIGSVDPAMTEKEMNDPSGFTKWGIFEDHGRPRVMLIGAWQKRLQIIGPAMTQEVGEDDLEFKARKKAKWGLVDWLQDSCQRAPAADILLVENKASGYSVGQAIVALNTQAPFGIVMIDPKGRDKVSRAMAVQHMFADGMVYAPLDKKFAEIVVEQMEVFPKGKDDHIVDSATQVMRWLRDNGFVERQEDILAESMSSMQHRGPERPLYPV